MVLTHVKMDNGVVYTLKSLLVKIMVTILFSALT